MRARTGRSPGRWPRLTRASAMGVLAGAAITQIDAAAVQRVLTGAQPLAA
ncbi:MAG: hypothetical protein JNJ42_00135 [Burkholderiaceae bacterium]|nr:hypothetical protein [Burkholderiaceae bacterium]